MSGVELLAAVLSSAGFIAGVASIIKTVLEHRRGVQSREDEAEERHITRLETRNATLEKDFAEKSSEYNHILDMYRDQVRENGDLQADNIKLRKALEKLGHTLED